LEPVVHDILPLLLLGCKAFPRLPSLGHILKRRKEYVRREKNEMMREMSVNDSDESESKIMTINQVRVLLSKMLKDL
jgi:Sec-independent protein translocase protein TatA